MTLFISDQYRKARGGWSRMLAISCKSCKYLLFHYQKDGLGPLKRSYFDRIVGTVPKLDAKGYIHCPQCKVCLGFYEPYAKENNRPVLRWAAEAITHTIVPARKILNRSR